MRKGKVTNLFPEQFNSLMSKLAIYDEHESGWFCKTGSCNGKKFLLSKSYFMINPHKAWAIAREHFEKYHAFELAVLEAAL